MREGLEVRTLWSESNRRRFEHWVWLPPGSHRDLPVVVLLHGVYDGGGSSWAQKGFADLTAGRLVAAGELPPFCLVMPGDTGAEQGTGYCDWRDGTTCAETYIVDELLPCLAADLPVAPGAMHIGGLSMGGYGALLLALRHPGLFRSASSTSGFFDPRRLFRFVNDAQQRMWGDGDGMRQHDVRALVEDPQRRGDLRIAFDCGADDELLDQNRALHAQLGELGVAHGYVERPGSHTWDYWSARLEHHLRFHLDRGGDLQP